MKILKSFAIGIASIALTVAMCATESVSASGASLIVNQTDPIGQYGSWNLSMPGDAKYESSMKAKMLNGLAPGIYTLSVSPPANAIANIEFIRSAVTVKNVTGNAIEFEVKDNVTHRINIDFIYTGTIEVLSDPEGIAFKMTNVINAATYSGTTPAIFRDMAPEGYKVQYAIKPSCEIQKSLKRELAYGGIVTFFRDFTCGDQPIALVGQTALEIKTDKKNPPATKVSMHEETPTKRIVQTSSMSEVVPGGTVRFTVSITNTTRTTLHNVRVTDRFNPSMLEILTPIPENGEIAENEIIWEIPSIYAGQTRTVHFTARASDHLVPGDRLVLMARAESQNEDFALYPEAWSAVTGVSIAYMPQTGDAYDVVLFMLAGLVCAGGMTLAMKMKQSRNV